jgi:hypothetical protein
MNETLYFIQIIVFIFVSLLANPVLGQQIDRWF